MTKLLLRCLPLLVAVALSAACGGAAEPFAAKVNDSLIGQDDLDAELKAIVGNGEYVAGIEQQGTKVRGGGANTFDSQFVARVLTRQVFLQLVHDELVRRRAMPTGGELAEARAEVIESVGGEEIFGRFSKGYQDTLVRRSAEVTKLQAALSPTAVDDAAIRAYYEQNPQDFSVTCVSHILLAAAGPDGRLDQAATQAQAEQLRAQAEELRSQITAGADFAAVAAASSRDTSNKDSGGSLGCLSKSDVENFAPPFVAAMEALAAGEVSQPVQTEFGYHLIKVTERKVESLQEAAPEIRQQLLQPTAQEFTRFVREAVDKARISVNPRYGRFDKKSQSPGVVPPEGPALDQETDVPGLGGGGRSPGAPAGR